MEEKSKGRKMTQTCAQGCRPSPEDKIAVCWYDQPYDIASWSTTTSTSQGRPDVRQEDKKRVETKSYRQTKNEQSYVQLVGQGQHSRLQKDREDGPRGAKHSREEKENSNGSDKYHDKVTQPTQNDRV